MDGDKTVDGMETEEWIELCARWKKCGWEGGQTDRQVGR